MECQISQHLYSGHDSLKLDEDFSLMFDPVYLGSGFVPITESNHGSRVQSTFSQGFTVASEHEHDMSPANSGSPESERMELPCLLDDIIDFSQVDSRGAIREKPLPIKEEHSYSNEILNLGVNLGCNFDREASLLCTDSPTFSQERIFETLELTQADAYNNHGSQAAQMVSPSASCGSSSSDSESNCASFSEINSSVQRPQRTYRGVPVNSPGSTVLFDPNSEGSCEQSSQNSMTSLTCSIPGGENYFEPSPVNMTSNNSYSQLSGFTPGGFYTHEQIHETNLAHNQSRYQSHAIRKQDDMLSMPLTEEEKRTFIVEGYPLPTEYPLSKIDEKNLKKVRRKLKNKWSAQESRRKKKEYLESVEQKCQMMSSENELLKKRVNSLEYDNKSLMDQLRKLQQLVSNITGTSLKAASNSTCLMMATVFLSALFTSYVPFGEELSLTSGSTVTWRPATTNFPTGYSSPLLWPFSSHVDSGLGYRWHFSRGVPSGHGFIVRPFTPDSILLPDSEATLAGNGSPFATFQMKSRVLHTPAELPLATQVSPNPDHPKMPPHQCAPPVFPIPSEIPRAFFPQVRSGGHKRNLSSSSFIMPPLVMGLQNRSRLYEEIQIVENLGLEPSNMRNLTISM